MRTRSEIIKDLKVIWGENWETNMEIISDYHFSHGYDTSLPQSQIDRSNELIWELQRIEE